MGKFCTVKRLGVPPARHDRHRHARLLEEGERALEEDTGLGVAVGERHEPVEVEPGQPHSQASPVQRRLRGLHAGAPEARIALDEESHVDPAPPAGLRETPGHHLVVEHDRQAANPLDQAHEALGLDQTEDVVGEQHVLGEPGIGEDLDLAQLLAGDAKGAGGELQAADGRDLVRLDVRPVADAVAVEVGLHPPDVALHDVEADGDRGRIELGGGLRTFVPQRIT
jgi:hypothetical protein